MTAAHLTDAEAFAAWPGLNPIAELLAARRCQALAMAAGWRYVDDCSPVDASGAGIVDGASYDGTAGDDHVETVYTSWVACALAEGLTEDD